MIRLHAYIANLRLRGAGAAPAMSDCYVGLLRARSTTRDDKGTSMYSGSTAPLQLQLRLRWLSLCNTEHLLANRAPIDLDHTSRVQIVTREYEDKGEPSAWAPRGGDQASTHVELLGNKHFMHDFLHAAAGWHADIDEDVITSNIAEITARLP